VAWYWAAVHQLRDTELEVKVETNEGKVEAVAELCEGGPCIKVTHVFTASQGWTSDTLHGAHKGMIYRETIRATEEKFWDQQ
jgi:hypothetical protein